MIQPQNEVSNHSSQPHQRKQLILIKDTDNNRADTLPLFSSIPVSSSSWFVKLILQFINDIDDYYDLKQVWGINNHWSISTFDQFNTIRTPSRHVHNHTTISNWRLVYATIPCSRLICIHSKDCVLPRYIKTIEVDDLGKDMHNKTNNKNFT